MAFTVTDTRTGKQFGTFATFEQATRVADRRDEAFGAVCTRVQRTGAVEVRGEDATAFAEARAFVQQCLAAARAA